MDPLLRANTNYKLGFRKWCWLCKHNLNKTINGLFTKHNLQKAYDVGLDPFNLLDAPFDYRCLIGRLLFDIFSRPNIIFSIHKVSQFVAHPRQPYLNVFHSLLLYLKGSPNYGIFFRLSYSFQLHALSYANWPSYSNSRNWQHTFVFSWVILRFCREQKKHTTLSQSLVEAEYRTLTITTSELIWLSQLQMAYKSCPMIQPLSFVTTRTSFI